MTPVILPPERFPRGLYDLARPPRELFLWGALPPPPWVAIVGTREPTPESAEFARRLARELAALGIVIASGGARGIDAAAHEGALEAEASTVVVAPGGFDRPYPPDHAELFARIVAEQGGYLSRVQGDVPAQRHVFFQRNQLLVACSEVVVVVEAPLQSGARNAAHWARKLGRPLWVVPHPPWNVQGEGCIEELRLGARALKSSLDVLGSLRARHWPAVWGSTEHAHARFDSPAQALLPFADEANEPRRGFSVAATGEAEASNPELDTPSWRSARLAVHAALKAGAIHADQIQRLTGLSIDCVLVLLAELDVANVARVDP